jgi:hypothetical protein
MIIQRCLNSQPTERFQSASDLAFALRNVTGGTAAAAVTGPVSSSRSFFSDPPGAEPVRFEPFPLLHLVTPTRLAWAANSAELLVFTAGTAKIHRVSLRDQSVREFPVEGRLDVSWGLDPRFAVVARPTMTAARSGLEWLDTETRNLFPLMASESALSYPSVSADGTRVAYTTTDLDYDLVEIPLDGSPIRPLLASRLPEHSVHYSPRAAEFAYTAAAGGGEIRIR